jgi:hypothetical protein
LRGDRTRQALLEVADDRIDRGARLVLGNAGALRDLVDELLHGTSGRW